MADFEIQLVDQSTGVVLHPAGVGLSGLTAAVTGVADLEVGDHVFGIRFVALRPDLVYVGGAALQLIVGQIITTEPSCGGG